jgi:hypothetical protein
MKLMKDSSAELRLSRHETKQKRFGCGKASAAPSQSSTKKVRPSARAANYPDCRGSDYPGNGCGLFNPVGALWCLRCKAGFALGDNPWVRASAEALSSAAPLAPAL